MGIRERLLCNRRFRKIFYSFAFRLLLLNLKKNHLLLIFWLILFGFITKAIAARYGVPFLFLNPDYLGQVGFLSYFIVGFSCGGFILAYNIASYILHGFRFPFLATLSHPFWKYCLNNFILPVAFIITYCTQIFLFLRSEQLGLTETLLMIAAFLAGITAFLFIGLTYFFRANKDIYKMHGIKPLDPKEDMKLKKRQLAAKHSGKRNPYLITESRDWYVETYLSGPFRTRLVRPVKHYKKEMLKSVFRQNHKAAAYFEIIAVLSLLNLGLLREYPAFEIPAGASIFLLFTMFLMLTSALHTWFRGWSTAMIILIIVATNFLYRSDLINSDNRAFGLNYKTEKAEFSYNALKKYDAAKELRSGDIALTTEILERWKEKNMKGRDSTYKPKIVFINTSGGGLRSTLWTFRVLQYADSLMNGELMNHTQLMTGSSGGMVGAAYFRELYLQHKEGKRPVYFGDSLLTNISGDMLNPIAFTIATNDLFFRFQRFRDSSYSYVKDRGYAFENALNKNTGQVLAQKRLRDYAAPEASSTIPMMVLSPTIINDGRKLLISPQRISYLAQNAIRGTVYTQPLLECVEYGRFFEKQDGDNLRFTSALRMNATFPYVTPIVTLPSEPAMEVMDAGMRDNYGLETTLKFLFAFRKWIAENTSGVVILQMRDRHKEFPIEETPARTLFQNFSRPLGRFYGNLFNTQDFMQNQQMQYASLWFSGKIDVLNFELQNEMPDNISLSWHLTKREKRKVLNSIHLKENQENLELLQQLLK